MGFSAGFCFEFCGSDELFSWKFWLPLMFVPSLEVFQSGIWKTVRLRSSDAIRVYRDVLAIMCILHKTKVLEIYCEIWGNKNPNGKFPLASLMWPITITCRCKVWQLKVLQGWHYTCSDLTLARPHHCGDHLSGCHNTAQTQSQKLSPRSAAFTHSHTFKQYPQTHIRVIEERKKELWSWYFLRIIIIYYEV